MPLRVARVVKKNKSVVGFLNASGGGCWQKLLKGKRHGTGGGGSSLCISSNMSSGGQASHR